MDSEDEDLKAQQEMIRKTLREEEEKKRKSDALFASQIFEKMKEQDKPRSEMLAKSTERGIGSSSSAQNIKRRLVTHSLIGNSVSNFQSRVETKNRNLPPGVSPLLFNERASRGVSANSKGSQKGSNVSKESISSRGSRGKPPLLIKQGPERAKKSLLSVEVQNQREKELFTDYGQTHQNSHRDTRIPKSTGMDEEVQLRILRKTDDRIISRPPTGSSGEILNHRRHRKSVDGQNQKVNIQQLQIERRKQSRVQTMLAGGDLSYVESNQIDADAIREVFQKLNAAYKSVDCKICGFKRSMGLLVGMLKVIRRDKKYEADLELNDEILGLFRAETDETNLHAKWKTHVLRLIKPDVIFSRNGNKYVLVKYFLFTTIGSNNSHK